MTHHEMGEMENMIDEVALDYEDLKTRVGKMESTKKTDRLIIRTLRMAIAGLAAIGILFVIYIVATLYVSARDNRRIDALEHRIEKLEPVEAP